MAESARKIPTSEATAGKTSTLKQATDTLKQATESLNQAFAPPENSGDLEAFLQANKAIMNGMAVLSSEMMDFGNRQLHEYTKRSESLVGCKDAEEAFRIQCDFAQSATQRYLDQSNNLLTLLAKMTEDFWAPLQEHTRQALQGLNKEAR